MAQVTIAIPFYSNIDYLKEAVHSVLNQTFHDFYCLVSDDFGPDGVEAHRFVSELNDSRFQYHRHSKNLGLAGNWNFCLAAAQTNFVTLLHADDRLSPRYLESMLAFARKHPDVSGFFCGAKIIDKRGLPRFSFPDFVKRFTSPRRTGSRILVKGDEGLASLLKGCYIFCPTILYNKSVLGTSYFSEDWSMVLDLDYYGRLLFKGQCLLGSTESLYEYRRHESNQTSIMTASLVRFEEESKLYDFFYDRSLEENWPRTSAVARSKRILKLNLLYCIVTEFFRHPQLAFRKLKFLTRLYLS